MFIVPPYFLKKKFSKILNVFHVKAVELKLEVLYCIVTKV